MRTKRWGQRWKRAGLGAVLVVCAALTGSAQARETASAGSTRHTPRLHAFRVQEGVLTLDGLTLRTHINLRTAAWQSLFIDLPAVGVVRISEQPFPGSAEQKAAFQGNVLTVRAGGRRLELTASNRLRRAKSAYVRFDPGPGRGNTLPAIGYGGETLASVVWAGEETTPAGTPRHLRVNGRRSARTAKLCQPSKSGRERCAIVREVLYHP